MNCRAPSRYCAAMLSSNCWQLLARSFASAGSRQTSEVLPEVLNRLEDGLLAAQITELLTRGQGLESGCNNTAATASGLAPSARLGSCFQTERPASTDLQLPADGVRPFKSAGCSRLHKSRRGLFQRRCSTGRAAATSRVRRARPKLSSCFCFVNAQLQLASCSKLSNTVHQA